MKMSAPASSTASTGIAAGSWASHHSSGVAGQSLSGIAVTRIGAGLATLESDLEPFRSALAAGVKAVMVGHPRVRPERFQPCPRGGNAAARFPSHEDDAHLGASQIDSLLGGNFGEMQGVGGRATQDRCFQVQAALQAKRQVAEHGVGGLHGALVLAHAGSLDYRAHPQPVLGGNERWLLYPEGGSAGTGPSTGPARDTPAPPETPRPTAPVPQRTPTTTARTVSPIGPTTGQLTLTWPRSPST